MGGALDNPAVSGGADMSVNDLWEYTPSNSKWTWMNGTSGNTQQAYYGTQDVASSSNFPSARGFPESWVDSSGNLWLFGGYNVDAFQNLMWTTINDFWKYTPSTSQWTWIAGTSWNGQDGTFGTKGTGSTSNLPMGKWSGMTWVDASGNFWLFGGLGKDDNQNGGDWNDLWKYVPSSSQWTWVSGASTANQLPVYGTKGTGSTGNIPGARDSSVTWIDTSGSLWLFGGIGFDGTGAYQQINDLWKFNPSNSQWTWVSGASTVGQSGTYGTQGIGSTGNIPGGRQWASAWIDSSGYLWLYGGLGFDSQGNQGLLNDLWKFQPSTSQWTWVGGATTYGAAAVYGTLGVASGSNTPGARNNAVSWIDTSGNLWLMGGAMNWDYTSTGGKAWMNDVWKYTPSTSQWTWMAGSSLQYPSGVYNTLGAGALSGVPGGRDGEGFWHDKSGNVWLFGGFATDAYGVTGVMNDFWKLSP